MKDFKIIKFDPNYRKEEEDETLEALAVGTLQIDLLYIIDANQPAYSVDVGFYEDIEISQELLSTYFNLLNENLLNSIRVIFSDPYNN